MTPDLMDQGLRAFTRRRPFRRIWIEFNSGGRLLASHPETVRREGNLFVARDIDGRYEIFAAENVSRLQEAEMTEPGS
jgi:hypothetical protein